MAKLVSGAFEEASLGDEISISSQVDVYKIDNEKPIEKKGGILQHDNDDERIVIHKPHQSDSKQLRIHNYSLTSESSGSLYIDPAEEAAAQESLLANPRRTSTVVHETLEYLQEIGTGNDEETVYLKRAPSVVEPKVIMPPVLEIDNKNEESGSENEPEEVIQPIEAPIHSAWNYATALDENDITSHRHLVCVPKSLKYSEVIYLYF